MPLSSNLFVQKRSSTTSVKQPKELGYYSRTIENKFLIQDDSQLSYYYLPDSFIDRNYDLTMGIKRFKESGESEFDQSTLHGLLATIQEYEKRKGKKVKADIITFRGVMRKLITCAFENSKYNKMELQVVSFDEQIFIREARSSHSTPGGSRESNEYRSYYSGYKFESLATLPSPFTEASREVLEKRHKKIVNNSEQYISVVRTGIGKCKLVLGAEVDCVFDFKEASADNLKHYAELKCTKAVHTIPQARSFELKLFKTWMQCFLVGVNRIIYGFRDDNFILRSVEEYATQEIPVLLKQNTQLSNSCLDAMKWYGALTEWLLDTIPREPGTEIRAYSLVYEHNHLKLQELSETDKYYNELVHGDLLLSESFKNWRINLKNPQSDD